MKTTCFFLGAFLLAERAAAWGPLGHSAVGYIAMEFLAPNAADFVKKTVEDRYKNNLGLAANWADGVRTLPAYHWSAPWHFIDAEDHPKEGSCSVLQKRDCGKSGCILTAIANYTQRVSDTSLGEHETREALYFLDHFIGDIGQPLHIEALERGGNLIHAKCHRRTDKLHAIWDTGIIKTLVNADYSGSDEEWASALVKEIKTGNYKDASAGWISCASSLDPLSAHYSLETDVQTLLASPYSRDMVDNLACPLVWAKESNALDCSNVFKYEEGEDLCVGPYYDTNIVVINEQIAKQGFRLAAWLNIIFDGSASLP